MAIGRAHDGEVYTPNDIEQREMNMARRYVALSLVACLGACGSAALAQTYPAKPIRILTQSVGGNPDFASRLIAQGIAPALGQPVVVENRPSVVVLGETVMRAPPDGYTLLLTAGTLWLTPLLQRDVPYDVARDFAPITTVATAPSFVVVHPALPVHSVKQLIALAKARPGALNYASGVIGGADHLAAELFKVMAGVNLTQVAYSSAALLMTNLIGGHVHLAFAAGATGAPHIRSGKLRALATTGSRPSPVFPNLPPVAATVPGYEAVQVLGMWAPAATPPAIVNRLNQEVVRVLQSPEAKEKFVSMAGEAAGSTPEQFAALIRAEVAKWSKVIQAAGIRPN